MTEDKPQTAVGKLSGWGRYPRARQTTLMRPERMSEAVPPPTGHVLARGQGRSYGDAALADDGLVLLTERLNRFRSFDETTGLLRAEAGVTLAELLSTFVPRGWFLPVTPGTKYASLGGCIAADVHGKNHHRDGTLGAHVSELELVLADGSRRRCSPRVDAELFWATVGGMGLTGIITELALRLMPIATAYMIVRHEQARDLDKLLELLTDDAWDDQYSVAWVDCRARGRALGRGVLIRGHHATAAELPRKLDAPLQLKLRAPRNLPFDFPTWVLNPYTLAAFNQCYYHWQGTRTTPFVATYDSFFYPLDRLGHWNRMYGARGFIQYQCVLPPSVAGRGLRLLLEALHGAGLTSFLAVLKRFGPSNPAPLSFPLAGYTLTLDLPVSGTRLFTLLERFDEIVLEHGGRVYLAKDACLTAARLRGMYPRLAEWQRVKTRVDPHDRFCSALSRRLRLGADA
jgi:decaprenylphospho-beta-D-ribofuranose 2-oxidase